MKKSKYYHYLKINKDTYAIFNSLILDIKYINSKNFKLIDDNQFSKLSSNLKNELVTKGILINSESYDKKAYDILFNHYIRDCRKLNFLYLILSQGCNLGCKYCFLENMNANWKNIKMSFDVAKISVDKFMEHLIKNNIAEANIMLFGGEPLINWNIFKKIIEYTKRTYPKFFRKNGKQKLTFNTVTNGTLITDEKAKYFKKHNVTPAISIDGPKDINDKNRVFKNGNKSVYESVLESINILKRNNCQFGLSITLSKEVIDRDEIISWLKKLDVKDIYFNPLHYNEKNDIWEEHYKKSTKFIIDSFFELLKNDIVNGRPVRQISSFVKRSFYFSDCGLAGVHQLTIKPDGEVLVCQCDYNSSDNKLGNIITDDLDSLLNNKNTNRWINATPICKEKCLDCESIFICGGSCLTQNNNVFDNSCMVDETYCVYIKMMLEWLIN